MSPENVDERIIASVHFARFVCIFKGAFLQKIFVAMLL